MSVSRPWILRSYRLGLLVAVALTMRAQQEWRFDQQAALPVTLELARVFFPEADQISDRDAASGGVYVLDDFGEAIGIILTTLPEAESIVGYSGPTNVAIALDPAETVVGLQILSSGDTANHVDEVVQDTGFFAAFEGLRHGEAGSPDIHAVSGATLTSSAIAKGVLLRLGIGDVSLLFPFPVILEEARDAFAEASAIEADPNQPGRVRVLDSEDGLLGYILRTSPQSDPVIGYKGPTESLIALDPDGETIRKILVRESYETETYLAYVTGDGRFLPSFEGWTTDDLRNLDYAESGISGVSGATKTSMAVLEGAKRRLQADASAGPASNWTFRLRDGLLIGVIALGCVMAFTGLRGNKRLRTAYLIFLVVYVGWISGDMLSQTLLVGWAQHGMAWQNLPGLALLAVAAFLIPWSTGKQVYCHQLCPHGAAQQLLAQVRRGPGLRISQRAAKLLEWIPWVLLAFVVLVAMAGWSFNLAALEPFDAYVIQLAGAATIIISVVGLIASWFVPLAYCRFGCPTGALLKWIRSKGGGDRFGSRDFAALGLFGLALVTGWILRLV